MLRQAFGVTARLPLRAARLPGAAMRAAATALRSRPVTRTAPGRSHIPVRGVREPGTEAFAQALRDALTGLPGVARAEVNGVLGHVMVVHDDRVRPSALISAVEDVERRFGLDRAPLARTAHPADGQLILREAALAGVDLAGCGLAVAGRLLRAVPLPPGIPAALALAEVTPPLRGPLERRIGRPGTEVLFGVGVAVTNAFAQQPSGPLLDFAHRLLLLAELGARRTAWRRREPGLLTPGAFEAGPPSPVSRPVPLPAGAVERMGWSVAAALGATAGTYALTRNGMRAQGVLAAGVPRAAWLGREAFAARLGRLLAGRGVLVMDPDVLRQLDRVDRVVVDASAVRTGRLVIDEVVPLVETPAPEELYDRARTMADLDEPLARRRDGEWTLSPLQRGAGGAAGGAATALDVRRAHVRARMLRRRGARVLVLERGAEPVALVSVVPELDPLAEALMEAARRAAPVLLAGVGSGLDRRLSVDGLVAGGNRLRESVRSLQRDGHAVALVSARGGAALAAADVGIGLLGGLDHPAWSAHLLCGPGLEGACLVLDAVPRAHDASRRSARLAGLGSATGTLLATAVPPVLAARRAQLAVNAATVVAMAGGIWSSTELAHRPGPVPLDRTPWHAWSPQAVLERLGSSPAGLPEQEARRRQGRPGTGPVPPRGLLRLTVEELDNPLTPVLAAGAGISAAVGSVVDAALIGTVLGVNALMSGAQRLGADRALRQLIDLSAVRVRLRRPDAPGAPRTGAEVPAVADELVPGDVVRLTAGDAVPADCRLLRADNLEIDESSLTGESQLVAKAVRPSLSHTVADRHSMLYQGSVVAAGEAVAVVVATGADTEIGRTARLAGEHRPESGVARRLHRLTEVTLPASLAAGATLMGSDLLRGRPLADALGSAVSLAVAAVPEGLPFVATAAELATARRLSRRGALVRNPATIEALGRIDVLCFDKTGTLTEGRLRLRQVSDGIAAAPTQDLPERLRDVVAVALRAGPDYTGRRLPHPTDRAVLHAVDRLGLTADRGLGGWRRVGELPFEPGRGYHAVLGDSTAGRRLSVKGAPEIVLERCRDWCHDGRTQPFDAAARERVEREVDRLARLGYRVLAVAERPASDRQDLTDARVDRLCLHGLLCIADPVRPAAARAVARLRTAGVDVVMITGDHPSTAEAIAAELGVLDGRVLTGADLDALDDDRLTAVVAGVSVFARVSPAQKARVVRALHAAGRVVAVTGDGANDAPAIRLADVGIALGERATPAARETADVVITDDRIETITDAIVDCRAMWRSARDALAVLLGGNLGEIGFTVGVGLARGAGPLNVRQLLLVNLLTDMLPAIALAVRPPSGVSREQLLAEGPERSLGTALTRDIAVRAGTTAGAASVAWLFGRATGTAAQASTTGLVALVGTQLLQTVAAGGTDPLVLGSGLASLGLLGVIVQVPGLSHLFGCRPLPPHCWMLALGSAGAFALPAILFTRPLGIPLTRLTGRGADRLGTWMKCYPLFT
ncbi:cation-transporting ATPase I [Thermomonospora echinospora]|uniref:Cation-transporting ATPase I n=1 Tax=Thermomonospora echinospora TaxID=1992 RepID=A0A1H5XR23_9ACTN|nr:cation-translocating P-type ATPase [Thermomonospora echinospora]SEG14112.1 cation-transporting ATPase I [Thermomonospora echinospora]